MKYHHVVAQRNKIVALGNTTFIHMNYLNNLIKVGATGQTVSTGSDHGISLTGNMTRGFCPSTRTFHKDFHRVVTST